MKRSRKLVLLIGGLSLLLVAGVAVAAWLISGTGSGSAKAGTAGGLTVAPGTATADLYPGFTHGKVYVKVTNTNSFPVQLTSADITGPVTPTTCSVTVNAPSIPLSGITIAAGATADVTVDNALTMAADAADACQNADLVVGNVTVKGQSAQ